jgi:hypothetical protein
MSQLESADDVIGVIGHSYGGNRARLYGLYLRNNWLLTPDALVTIDPIDWSTCVPRTFLLEQCVIETRPCDQSTLTYPTVLGMSKRLDYVQRSTIFPALCIQGYNLLKTTSTSVPNVDHSTIDNDESYVHPGISLLFSGLLRTPKVLNVSISGVKVSNVTDTTAVVSWNTNINIGGAVEYGTTQSYSNVILSSSLASNHSVMLTGLSAKTKYHFNIVSLSSSNSVVTADNTFTTPH